ncbi:MAG: SWIM zinc finger family protein [Polyangiales bacterium]
MIVQFKYAGQSAITSGLRTTDVQLATNQLREAAFFKGTLGAPLQMREGLAALYDVVVSDFKYHPRDRLAFKAWMEEQDKKFLASLAVKGEQARQRILELEARRDELDRARFDRMKPFFRARHDYFEWVYTHQYELNYLFDPVITVHPDEVFFEAFSRDESSYARLAAKYDLFEKIDEFECGTTNIDFSAKLHGELDRMRTYRRTRFDIDPSGFTVHSEGGPSHKEKKIDLPESWVKGFLQVHATMSLGLTRFRMEPVDLFNLCRFLRRHKTKVSPRAMRFELTPGEPVRVVMEPWNHTIELSPTSVYEGPKKATIRTWGRDRLLTLARLIPQAQKVEVFLAGEGLPSLYVVDLGELTFTLGLSGWTDNDWTSGKQKFDLLARRLPATAAEVMTTYEALKKTRYAKDSALAQETQLGVEKTRGALSYLCQVGRAMFDLGGGVYRHRELFAEPFTIKEAQAAVKPAPASVQSTEDVKAQSIFKAGGVMITARRPVPTGGYKLSGSVKDASGARVRPTLSADDEGRIVEATCSCAQFTKYGLTKGPCEHILALRLGHMSRLEQEDGG